MISTENRDFKTFKTLKRRQWERRSKSEFAFFQSLSQLFLPTYFVKCRRALLNHSLLIPKDHIQVTERKIKCRRCLFTSCIKREIRHFQVIVVQKRANKLIREMYKKAWCTCKVVVLLLNPIVYLTFSLPSASLNLKVPNIRVAVSAPSCWKPESIFGHTSPNLW